MNHVICFDIGGTNVKYGILTVEKEIIEKSYFKTDINCGEKVKDQMCEIILDFIHRYPVVGITFSSPGFVNTKTGVIESGTTLEGFTGFAIKDYFEEKFNLPVTVENDANCATIAEHVLGNGKGYENIACITVGTGIGGGIIINNQIYSGSNFMAGEFGFMILEQDDNKEIGSNTFSRLASTSSLIKR
ncbi:MAG: ROK family protein, partial [Turicibacter sp.]